MRWLIAISIMLGTFAPCFAAEGGGRKLSKAEQAEKELMDEEDAQEQKLDGESQSPLKRFSVYGRILLTVAQDAQFNKDAVIGTLGAADKTYQLKAATPEVLKELMQFNGKEVLVEGKLRAQGKYLIVLNVGGGGLAPPAAKTNRRRI